MRLHPAQLPVTVWVCKKGFRSIRSRGLHSNEKFSSSVNKFHEKKNKKMNGHIRTFILASCTDLFTCSVNSYTCIASVVDEWYMSMEHYRDDIDTSPRYWEKEKKAHAMANLAPHILSSTTWDQTQSPWWNTGTSGAPLNKFKWEIQCGAKRTHVFQIIVTLFIFNIKKLC
jgi:hypothetical protein